jgi:hypothetical protein
MEKVNLSLPNFTGTEIVIREGEAAKAFEPKAVLVKGTIESPLRWLEKKGSIMDWNECSLLVDKSSGIISLIVNEADPKGTQVIGKLELHPDFLKFDINTGEQIISHDLAEKIKMFRSCFKDKDTAMKLVKDLRNFTAKVNKELEAFKDDRANYALKKSQVVDTNLPQSFILVVPIFKGQPKENIEVEINIDADKLTCSLISPQANDYIAEFKDRIIDEQIKKIEELVPELVVIEI